MKKRTWMAGVLILAGVIAGKALAETAHAELLNDQGKKVGAATLEETPHGVLISLDLDGVPPGTHAFHIHEVGKCEPGFKSAGGHFNPTDKKHGVLSAAGMHAGDLPNLNVPESGKLKVDVFAAGVTLGPGKNSLLDADGSSLVIHAGPDDYKSDPAGEAGARFACGVIVK
jgi:superoxide dismutase, Cu-Zn family